MGRRAHFGKREFYFDWHLFIQFIICLENVFGSRDVFQYLTCKRLVSIMAGEFWKSLYNGAEVSSAIKSYYPAKESECFLGRGTPKNFLS